MQPPRGLVEREVEGLQRDLTLVAVQKKGSRTFTVIDPCIQCQRLLVNLDLKYIPEE